MLVLTMKFSRGVRAEPGDAGLAPRVSLRATARYAAVPR